MKNSCMNTEICSQYWRKSMKILISAHWPLGDLDAIFKTVIFNLVLLIGFFRFSNDNAPRWMPWDLMDGKSISVQVMAWCRQASSHYLSQCWPSSMPSYDVTRPQWVNTLFLQGWELYIQLLNVLRPDQNGRQFADKIFQHNHFQYW